MIVGLDIDGVVADFLSPFLSFVGNKMGNGPIAPDSIIDFTFQRHPVLTEEVVWKCMEEVSSDPGFWEGLSSMITAEEWRDLECLSEKRQLIFLTNRFERESCDMRAVTRKWLTRHGVSNPVVYFTQERKGDLAEQLGLRLFMDDRQENCEDVANKTQAIVLMPHRPYNQSCAHPRVKRIWNFNELFVHLPQEDSKTSTSS